MSGGRIALIVVLALFCAGCISGYRMFHPSSIRTFESALQESNPDLRIESSMTFGVGAMLLGIANFVMDEEEFDISKINRLEVGVYEVSGQADFANFEIPDRAFDPRQCPDWDIVVRVREEDQQVFIVACVRDERVSAISIFVLEAEEIVVVNARGDFEGMIDSLAKAAGSRKGFLNGALALEI